MDINNLNARITPTFDSKEPVEELRLAHNTGVRGYNITLSARDKKDDRIAMSKEGFVHYHFNGGWYCLIGNYDKGEVYRYSHKAIREEGKLVEDLVKGIKIEEYVKVIKVEE